MNTAVGIARAAQAASQASTAASHAMDAAAHASVATTQANTAATAAASAAEAAASAVLALVPKHSHWYAEADWWVALGTFALACVTAILAYYTFQLWKDAREAAQRQSADTQASLALSQRMFAADHRPWVTLNVSLASELAHVEGRDWQLGVVGEVKNTGASPAARVMFTATLVPAVSMVGQRPEAFVAGKLQDLCSHATAMANISFGEVMFPSERRGHHFTMMCPQSDFVVPEGGTYFGQFRLLACAVYGTTFDDAVHVTAKTYALLMKNGVRIDLAGPSISQESLTLLELPGAPGTNYAS